MRSTSSTVNIYANIILQLSLDFKSALFTDITNG